VSGAGAIVEGVDTTGAEGARGVAGAGERLRKIPPAMMATAATPKPIHVGSWLLFLGENFDFADAREVGFNADLGGVVASPRSNVNSGSGSEESGSMENGSCSGEIGGGGGDD